MIHFLAQRSKKSNIRANRKLKGALWDLPNWWPEGGETGDTALRPTPKGSVRRQRAAGETLAEQNQEPLERDILKALGSAAKWEASEDKTENL